jgi:hypothetical protein
MKSLLSLYLLILGLQMGAFCQSRCNTFYKAPEVPPELPDKEMGLITHAQKKIIPLISAYYGKTDDDRITSLRATLYINRRGVVVDVIIPDDRITDSLRKKLCDEFMKMKNWKPARKNGQPVCATYEYVIRCLLWQE